MSPAARTIFVDTCYLAALVNPHDNLHERAVSVSKSLGPHRTLTTDFILIEVLRLYAKKGSDLRLAAVQICEQMRKDPNCEVVPANRSLFDQALALYSKREDKSWDMVDCASFITMKEKSVSEALTADQHFEQAGFRTLLRD